MLRTRSYHDLTPEGKVRYDRIRALQRRAKGKRKSNLKAAADLMLGLEMEPDRAITPVYEKNYKTWRGSSTRRFGDAR